ncbi:MAG: Bro-N domain-containing protein [Synergistaceae bacterium]|nr:Bro-N domain-containing protein [Synergistaceae bacterium]
MSNAIQEFNFNARQVRVVMKDNEPWFVAKDVCEILGYVNSRKALGDHLDEDEKGVTKCDTLGGAQEMNIINESGLYTLIIRSNKPEAKKFRKWVTSEVLPSIRKTGMYKTDKRRENDARRLELAERRLAIQQKNANARLAKIIQHMVDSPSYALTQESKQILVHEVTVLTTGKDYPEMLPDQTERYYSASEVGEIYNVSNRKVMQLARENEIIPPEGEVNDFGRWKMSKSKFSSHECAQWYFNELGRDRIGVLISAFVAPLYKDI